MVLKHDPCLNPRPCVFESDVKMYGTQTEIKRERLLGQFESDVKMYGTQTQKDF